MHKLKYHLFQISVVSECTLKRLGDLPFSFDTGTCGTLMVRNDGALSDINDFIFDSEFEIDSHSGFI